MSSGHVPGMEGVPKPEGREESRAALQAPAPNNALQLTAYSLRSSVASASGSS